MSEVFADDDKEKIIRRLEAHISAPEFTDDDFEHAEKELRRAFRTTAQGSASTSEFFHGMYRTENKTFKESKMPDFLVDKNYPDERRDRWATQVHFKESTAHFSKPPVGQQDYLHTSVHAIVNSLPEQHLVFIKANYMPEGSGRGEFLKRFFEMFWRDYQEKIPAGINRIVLFVFAQTVIATAGGNEKFLETMLREKVGGKRANWYRNYLPHWRAMKAEFATIRRGALVAYLRES